MIKTVETIGESLEDATRKAMEEIGIDDEADLDIEIMEEGSKGLFGLVGGKETRIRATYIPKAIRAGIEVLKKILNALQISGDINVEEEDGNYYIDVEGEGLAILIGKRGQTLEAVHYLVNTVANRTQKQRLSVIVDAHGYRRMRMRNIEELALKTARQVIENGEPVELAPMTSWERRMAHMTLMDHPDIETHSEGEEPFRKVVISPKKDY